MFKHVVRFGVRQVDLENIHRLVDPLIQFQSFHHLMNHADPTCRDRLRPIRNLIVGCSMRKSSDTVTQPRLIQSLLDASLACGQFPSYLGVHSKTLRVLKSWDLLPHKHRKNPESFRVFSFLLKRRSKGLRLIEG